MLNFDAETARVLDECYQGADIARRRRASFDALCPAPGETILDIGCGNGLLTQELARAVGPSGQVIGIDPSADMRRAADERCAGMQQVHIVEGRADKLGVAEGSADKAASLQVFEYLDDLPAAAKAAFAALRPGGLLAVGDMHYDTFAWHSDHPDRMRQIRQAWDCHFVEGRVPAILPDILRKTGFVVEDLRPLTFCDHVLRPDGLAMMMIRLMERYAAENGHVRPEIAQAWAEEQYDMARQGRFFFSMTHYVVVARRP